MSHDSASEILELVCLENLHKKCWRLSCNRLHVPWTVENQLREAISTGQPFNPTPLVQRERMRVSRNEALGPEATCLRFKHGVCFDPFCRKPHLTGREDVAPGDIITLRITPDSRAIDALVREESAASRIPRRYILRCHRLTPIDVLEKYMNDRLVSTFVCSRPVLT